MLRALLDAYPAAVEEKHPQVEVMFFSPVFWGYMFFGVSFGALIFVPFFEGICFLGVSHPKNAESNGFLTELSSDHFTLVV